MNDRNISFKKLLTLLIALPLSHTALAADEYVGQAVSVAGKVLVRGDTTGGNQMNFLKPGDKLYKGTIVNTGSNGAVKLLMTDRTIVDIGPSSLFKVNEYQLNGVGDRKVDMSLDYGQIRTSVNEKLTSAKGKFTIRTKAATMGVRGTEFVVNAPIPVKDASGAVIEPPKTSLTVMHGKVEVADMNASGAAGQPVAITPGFQFAKQGDGPAKVENLGAEGVAKIKSEAFQKDMTFLQTVSFDANTSKDNKDNSNQQQGDKVADKGKGDKNDKSGDKAGDKSGDSKASGDKTADKGSDGKKADGSAPATTTASSGGSKVLDGIAMNVATQASAPQPAITDLHLPGTFTPDVPTSRPIDQLNGRLVNLKVRICPTTGGC